MAFRISKPKVIDIGKGRPIVSRAESVACGLCKKNEAKYSCPQCNVPYCSLECYRSEEHRICSEGFYRDLIEEEIRSAPERTNEEKRAMVDILQRMAVPELFHESDGVIDGDGDDDDGDHLIDRLEGIDIDSADTKTLWAALSPRQRQEFAKAMQDPKSSIAKQLLDTITSSDNLASSIPWWETLEDEDIINQAGLSTSLVVTPNLIEVAEKAWRTGQPTLIFNIASVCIAYAFCIRTLHLKSLSTAQLDDAETCSDIIAQAVPFLTERKSFTRLENLDEVITYVQSRLDQPVTEVLLDVSSLFDVPMVSEISSSTNPTKLNICLTDISSIFTRSVASQSRSRKQTNHAIVHKLTYYVAHATAAPPEQLQRISQAFIKLYNNKPSAKALNLDLEGAGQQDAQRNHQAPTIQARIEEIG